MSKKSKSSESDNGLENIINEVQNVRNLVVENKNSILDIKKTVDIINERVNFMMALFSDLSAKVDLNICSTGIASASAKGVSTTSDKKPQNVMMFFKSKFKLSLQEPSKIVSKEEIEEACEFIYKIVTESEVEELYEANESDMKLKSKKKETLDTFKTNLVYKELIKDNDRKKDLIKSLKDDENNNPEPEIEEIEVELESSKKSSSSKSKVKTTKVKSTPVKTTKVKSTPVKTTKVKSTPVKTTKVKEPELDSSDESDIKSEPIEIQSDISDYESD
ncbi:MAG: hypothetical protein ACRCZI_08480 [Cetobacterium sp.]